MRTFKTWPWWLKMSVKLALSALPGSYEKHREKITGSHGNMEDPQFARRIFERFHSLHKKYNGCSEGPKVLLELGPGGSLASGLLARLVGFERSVLIDVGDFALKDVGYYTRLLASLPDSEYSVPKNMETPTFDQIRSRFSIDYKTNGLEDLKLLPPESADFVFSNSVLEHVRVRQFSRTCRELYRIQKRGTVGCHHVDFKDHLGGGLNHLRFSSDQWEKRWMSRAGFYTNRIGFEKMVALFEDAGFQVSVPHRSQWDRLPMKREKMATEFRQGSLDSLRTKGAILVLRK